MLKHVSICAAVIALGMGPAAAQYREAVLHKLEIPEAGFDILIATAKPGGWTFDPQQHSWAHAVYMGDRLVHPINEEMLALTKRARALSLPACSFEVQGGRNLRSPVAVHVVPKEMTRFSSTQR